MGWPSNKKEQRSRWRSILGWGIVILSALDKIVGWGGSIDFVLSRMEDPGWVRDLLNFLASHSEPISTLMLVVGIALIVWNERRRTDARVEALLVVVDAKIASISEVSPAPAPAPAQLPDDLEGRVRMGVAAMKIHLAQERERVIGSALKSGKEFLEADPPPSGTPRELMFQGRNPMRGVGPLRKCAFDLRLPVDELDERAAKYIQALSANPKNFTLVEGDEKHYWTTAAQKIEWLTYKARLKAHYDFLEEKRRLLWTDLSALHLTKDVEIPPR